MDQYESLVSGFEVGALLSYHAAELAQDGDGEKMQQLRQLQAQDKDKERCHELFSEICDKHDLVAPPIWDPINNAGLLTLEGRQELQDRVNACRKTIHDECGTKYEHIGKLIDWFIHVIYVWEGIHYFN